MSPVITLINIREIIIINGLLGMSYLVQGGRKIEDTIRSICRVQELQLANQRVKIDENTSQNNNIFPQF